MGHGERVQLAAKIIKFHGKGKDREQVWWRPSGREKVVSANRSSIHTYPRSSSQSTARGVTVVSAWGGEPHKGILLQSSLTFPAFRDRFHNQSR